MPAPRLLLPWLAAFAVLAPLAAQTTVNLTAVADTYIRDELTTRGSFEFLDVRGSPSLEFYSYVRFVLPADLGALNSATLSFERVAGSRNDTPTTARFRLWGLLDTAGNTSQAWAETGDNALNITNVGTENRATGAGLANLDGGTGVTETVAGNLISVSGASVVAFLQQRAAAGGLATFIVDFPDRANDRGYGLASRENTTGARLPTLTLDYAAIPEPSTLALLAPVLLFLLLLRRRD